MTTPRTGTCMADPPGHEDLECPRSSGRSLPHRQPDPVRDAGSVTLFLVISVLGLLVLVGLVVDGGAKIRAIQRADALAGEAARAAGQAINTPAAITGQARTVDRHAALAAAQTFLRTNHVTGTATVVNGGASVQVQVRISTPTVFLGLIGINHTTVTGQATADLITTSNTQAAGLGVYPVLAGMRRTS